MCDNGRGAASYMRGRSGMTRPARHQREILSYVQPTHTLLAIQRGKSIGDSETRRNKSDADVGTVVSREVHVLRVSRGVSYVV